MGDAADKVSADDERAMQLFEEQQQRRRIAESMKEAPYPEQPRPCFDCGIEIDAKRRAANPRTHRCTDCATIVELEWRRGARA